MDAILQTKNAEFHQFVKALLDHLLAHAAYNLISFYCHVVLQQHTHPTYKKILSNIVSVVSGHDRRFEPGQDIANVASVWVSAHTAN
jgi:hypothetical protein